MGNQLRLGLTLDQAQEVYLSCLQQYIVPNCLLDSTRPNYKTCRWDITQIKPLLKLGQSLAIDVSCWL